MKKVITTCDACGKETRSSHFYSAKLDFEINELGGGSVGGSENIFIQKADLCVECAHKLQRFIKDELNIKPHHP